MFSALTASSITLTLLPVQDSHTGRNCFSMGLEGGGGGCREGGEWGGGMREIVLVYMQVRKEEDALPKLPF